MKISTKKQINSQKSKTLNKSSPFGICLNFNNFSEIFVLRYIPMSDKSVYYFRITNIVIIPEFLYWHLVQDLRNKSIIRLHDGKKFLFKRHLGNSIIHYGDQTARLGDLGHFVNREDDANISIGWCHHNFGEVNLITNKLLSPEWNIKVN